MKAEVVITGDGKVSIFTREGSFQKGKAKILKFLELLQAQGIAFESIGDVEQHRHEMEIVKEGVRKHERAR